MIPLTHMLRAEQRGDKTVGDSTVAATSLESLDADESAREAIHRLGRGGDEGLPVVRSGQVVGLLRHSDVVKWIGLRGRAGLSQ